MIRGARVPERAYAVLLWVVSLVFAGFLVGLGGLVIGDLPQVERAVSREDFVDKAASTRLQSQLQVAERRQGAIDDRLGIARLRLEQAQRTSRTATETFQAWLGTRAVTADPARDTELLDRTRQLERLKGAERAVQDQIAGLENDQLAAGRQVAGLRDRQVALEAAAGPAYERAVFWQELRVFTLRLALALPMLLVAGWLIAKRRGGEYWPISRGFVIAAVFVFFVELVPYLPSYGGYVRYGVGIVLTLLAARWLIRHMRAYLERRRQAEAQDEAERRRLVSHDEAFRKMAAKVCPGCDRPVATMEGSESNFCVHCGLTLFDHCQRCDTRKMAFFRYCMTCGAPAGTNPASGPAAGDQIGRAAGPISAK